MPKQSGIGGLFLADGYDLSGDVGAISSVHDFGALLDVTGINKGAPERIHGIADGAIEFNAFFNDASGPPAGAHGVLKNPTGDDMYVTYAVGTTLGKAGWSLTGKQVDYAGTRGADGSIGFTASAQSSDGEGLRSGRMLTAGKRTDTGATTGGTVDWGSSAPTTFGAEIFWHVQASAGTDVTIKVQDSANGSAWNDLAGATFTPVIGSVKVKRIALAANATVRRYTRAVTTTSGGFSSVTFAVMLCRRYA